MTIEQVKEDIASGKSKRIYYSAHTLWWTHLDDDLKAATSLGHQAAQRNHERMMNDPAIPAEKKQKFAALWKMANSGEGYNMPMDPSGSPLMQTEHCLEWVTAAEKKPEHFGKHGLAAFIKSHHQNCAGMCFNSWKGYNDLLEIN